MRERPKGLPERTLVARLPPKRLLVRALGARLPTALVRERLPTERLPNALLPDVRLRPLQEPVLRASLFERGRLAVPDVRLRPLQEPALRASRFERGRLAAPDVVVREGVVRVRDAVERERIPAKRPVSPTEDEFRPRLDTLLRAGLTPCDPQLRVRSRFVAWVLRVRWALVCRLERLGAERLQEREERFQVLAAGAVERLRVGVGALTRGLRVRLDQLRLGADERLG